jgi:hypothetical protein
MNQDIFWKIIETAYRSDRHLMDEWHQPLIEELTLLSIFDMSHNLEKAESEQIPE